MKAFARELWETFGNVKFNDIPDTVRTVATHSILDWFGCAVAGAAEPLAGILRRECMETAGTCSVVGTASRTSAETAALINGACGHALDYDDTGNFGHPTAPILPAVLALAQTKRRSGQNILTALIVGHEIASRIGAAMGPDHYGKGWHTTSTIGVFGAAAACASMYGLDQERFGFTMGIAASQSSGVKANFGTMVKPLHAGLAAQRGLFSARLAASGFVSNPEAMEANQGLFQAAGSGRDHLQEGIMEPGEWHVAKTLFKYHAACYLTHATIDCVRSLASGIPSSEIESIQLRVHPAIIDVCGLYDEPTTGLEAKFSLKGTAAMAAAGLDTSRSENFSEPVLQRGDLRNLLHRIEITTDSNVGHMQTHAELIKTDGTRFKEFRDTGVPNPDLDDQGRRLEQKFIALTQPLIGDACAKLLEQIRSIGDLDGPDPLFGLSRSIRSTGM